MGSLSSKITRPRSQANFRHTLSVNQTIQLALPRAEAHTNDRNSIHFTERDGKREYAIVPIEIFERLMEAAEDMDDIALYHAAKVADDGTRLPAEVLYATLDGVHPIKAWRNHHKLTLQALADKAGISKGFLSQIENRKRVGDIKVLTAIARALDVPVNLLTE